MGVKKILDKSLIVIEVKIVLNRTVGAKLWMPRKLTAEADKVLSSLSPLIGGFCLSRNHIVLAYIHSWIEMLIVATHFTPF